MEEFYVLRYVAETPLNKRKHDNTLGRFPTWDDADSARQQQPNADILEVLGPRRDEAAR